MYIFKSKTLNHKTRLKLIINPILRKMQWFTDKPFVIASICDIIKQEDDGSYIIKFYHYKFMRVFYIKEQKIGKNR